MRIFGVNSTRFKLERPASGRFPCSALLLMTLFASLCFLIESAQVKAAQELPIQDAPARESLPYQQRFCGKFCEKISPEGWSCEASFSRAGKEAQCFMQPFPCAEACAACATCSEASAKTEECRNNFNKCMDRRALADPLKENLIAYRGGDGSSKEKAVLIQGVKNESSGLAAEHIWLRRTHPDWRLFNQIHHSENNRVYKKLSFGSSSGEQIIWFDITEYKGK